MGCANRPIACTSAANPLHFIDVPGGMFRAVTNTTAFWTRPVEGRQKYCPDGKRFSESMELAEAVGDEG